MYKIFTHPKVCGKRTYLGLPFHTEKLMVMAYWEIQRDDIMRSRMASISGGGFEKMATTVMAIDDMVTMVLLDHRQIHTFGCF